MEQGQMYRILDANVNRLREGLRVVEEYARFSMNDGHLQLTLKQSRELLKNFSEQDGLKGALLASRSAERDVGAKRTTRAESKRENEVEVLTANFKRAQEASRVLEEYAKIMDPKFGRDFKDLRFGLYDLEKEMVEGSSIQKKLTKLNFDLYVITDREASRGRSFETVVREAIQGGAQIIQYRDKGALPRDYFEIAERLRKITEKAGVTFIINDYIGMAAYLKVDGIHLGQDDVPVKVSRELLGPEQIIGVSTHSLQQAVQAERDGADYISVGPIYPTPSKPMTRPVTTGLLERVLKEVTIPVVAIGGVNAHNLIGVLHTGCTRAAVIRAVVNAPNVAQATKQLRAIFKKKRS